MSKILILNGRTEQGGSVANSIIIDWTKNENEMIACCSDGTRPVIFKIERMDYE